MFHCDAAEHPAPQRVRSGQREGTEVAKTAANGRVPVPVVEERAIVRKRKKVTGAVRVRTEVREAVDAPLAVERVEGERVPLDRWIAAPAPVRGEAHPTFAPIHEEVFVMEKRLRPTEEARIPRRTSPRHSPERV